MVGVTGFEPAGEPAFRLSSRQRPIVRVSGAKRPLVQLARRKKKARTPYGIRTWYGWRDSNPRPFDS